MLRAVLTAVAVLIIIYPVAAGTGRVVRCSKCGLQADLAYGMGMASRTVAVGYCCACEKFVRVSYNYRKVTDPEEQKKLETPLGTVFCHESGMRHNVYACPDCGKPFIAIEADDLGTPDEPKKLYCPKCAEQALESTGTIMWD